MGEDIEILLQAVVSGVAIYVLAEFFKEFFLKPFKDFSAIRMDIAHRLLFHENIIVNSGLNKELYEKVSLDLRDMASNLISKYVLLPIWYAKLLSKLNLFFSEEEIRESTKHLIFLSNAVFLDSQIEKREKSIQLIRQNLNI